MKRFFSLLLAAGLLAVLPACGQKNTEPTAVSYDSISQVSEALGYDLLALEKNSANLTFSSAAVLDDVIGQVDYETGDSAVELRMTLDESRFEGLAGYRNAGKAGGIEAPSEVFSRLELYVVDNSTYFCEFSYTYEDYTCYLSLAETRTDFDTYSILLINYVNQIYNMEETPDFVYKLNPDYGRDTESAEAEQSAAADTSGKAYASAQAQSDAGDAGKQETEQAAEQEKTQAKQEESGKEEDAAEEKEEKEEKKAEKEEETGKDEDSGSITLEYYDITLVNIGDSYTFSPSGGNGSYSWKSADSSVATVSDSGTVTAAGSGQTTVTCTSGDLSAEIIVRVP